MGSRTWAQGLRLRVLAAAFRVGVPAEQKGAGCLRSLPRGLRALRVPACGASPWGLRCCCGRAVVWEMPERILILRIVRSCERS